MKLIIQNAKVAATATDEYSGPDESIHAPDDFDIHRIEQYKVVDGVVVLTCPQSLTRRQFKLALIRLGLYETVESMIASTTDLELRVTYQEAQDFERGHPMIVQMARLLGKTDAELDELFILGGTQ